MSNRQERTAPSSIVAADFLLGPEAFIDRCAMTFGLKEADLTQSDRHALVDALKAGRPRFEIIDTLRSRSNGSDPRHSRPTTNSVPSEWTNFTVQALLERFAPDDPEAFVRQAFAQLLSREATPLDVAENALDLKSGRIERKELITKLAARGRLARLSPDPVFAEAIETKTAKPLTIVLVKYKDGEWILSPDAQFAISKCQDGVFELDEGWFMTGPKRSLPGNAWRLDLSFVQDVQAELVVDVVANAGLDTLFKAVFVGPTQMSARIDLKPWHHFPEVRILKPAQETHVRWLKVREISLVKMS